MPRDAVSRTANVERTGRYYFSSPVRLILLFSPRTCTENGDSKEIEKLMAEAAEGGLFQVIILKQSI